MQRDQSVGLLAHFQQVAASIPMHHQALLLTEISLNGITGQWATALGIVNTHTFGTADAEGSGFATDHRVVTGLCEMGHHDMWQGVAQRHVDDQGFDISLAEGAQCRLHRLLVYRVKSRVVRHQGSVQ